MKLLETRFKKDGFTFEQLKRLDNVAVFAKSKGGKSKSYEVVKIQSHNGFEISGVKIEPAETMPSSEQWGTNGFTFTTLQDALYKFNQLTQ